MTTETEDRARAQSEWRDGQTIVPMRADDHTDADPARETPVEARQGFLGRPVLMVLLGGLALVAVAWLIVDLVA